MTPKAASLGEARLSLSPAKPGRMFLARSVGTVGNFGYRFTPREADDACIILQRFVGSENLFDKHKNCQVEPCGLA
jgi:hypothetical protein